MHNAIITIIITTDCDRTVDSQYFITCTQWDVTLAAKLCVKGVLGGPLRCYGPAVVAATALEGNYVPPQGEGGHK